MRFTGGEAIETLIFDLGNVIVDLDELAVLKGFAQHAEVEEDAIKQLIIGNSDLYAYETGAIQQEAFIANVSRALKMDISVSEFERIWNSMLAEIPIGKLELLEQCTDSYQTIIMSNTNQMHQDAFDQMVAERSGGKQMSDYVHTAYYSHTMGLRKPDVAVFEEILKVHELSPQQVAFFDDKKENIQAAKQVGIVGVWVEHPEDLYRYFE